MKRAFVAALIGSGLLSACQSSDRTSYDEALSCLEAAESMTAAAETAKAPTNAFEDARRTFYAKAVAEGATIGKAEADVRSDISERLDVAMARVTDDAGKPDMPKLKADLTEQNARLQSCLTKA